MDENSGLINRSASDCQRLAGRRAIVTAAGQGIGKATAQRLAAEGAEVVAIDLNAQSLTEVETDRITIVTADVTDPVALTAIFADAGDIDILVNCVGWVPQGTLLDCTPSDWQASFRINVDTMYTTIRLVLPKMIRRGCGSIINIGSVSGLKAVRNRAAYSATKAAVVGITKSVAIDFIGQGVRCNAICPATVITPSLEERVNAAADPEEERLRFVRSHPIGRLGRPEEIAAMAAYLASDESGFVTGSTLLIDGGMAA
jgi:2-keto-3-deoxy-L-fuconate dehydrogenase